MRGLLASAIGLAALGAVAHAGEPAKADLRALTQARLSRAAGQVRDYRAATGDLPLSRDGIEGVLADPNELVDGWGNPIVYLRVAGGFWLVSWGADGAPGGTGDAADLVEISR